MALGPELASDGIGEHLDPFIPWGPELSLCLPWISLPGTLWCCGSFLHAPWTRTWHSVGDSMFSLCLLQAAWPGGAWTSVTPIPAIPPSLFPAPAPAPAMGAQGSCRLGRDSSAGPWLALGLDSPAQASPSHAACSRGRTWSTKCSSSCGLTALCLVFCPPPAAGGASLGTAGL